MENLHFDTVIIGSGAAGLYAALNLDNHLSCALITKSVHGESNSIFAQGGIAAVTQAGDSFEDHIKDTLTAGAGLCDSNAVEILVKEGPQDIGELIRIGVPFDRDSAGDLQITREGAHSCSRILHCSGDATGFHLTKTLMERVAVRGNVTLLEGLTLIDVLADREGCVCGALMLEKNSRLVKIDSPNVILATGGVGRIFRNSTNASCVTGDGIAAAIRAGAAVKNMEFVQFHPTALIHPGPKGRYFLISEALRGEGAVLRNRKWEAFMNGYHPLADLAPRDVVSRAIITEMKKHDLPHVYLDITHRPREFLRERFPTIYGECMSQDIDIAVNWIPVLPVQHYFMGGIKTDVHGRTSIPGLYACGECACTGVHGANRLASNSLLECLVFGRRAAQDIGTRQIREADLTSQIKPEREFDVSTMRTNIRNSMTKQCGILRNKTDMEKAKKEIAGMLELLEQSKLTTQREVETLNMALVARRILDAAIERKQSVGAHYRSDDAGNEGLSWN